MTTNTNYDLSRFSVISFKESEKDKKEIELCKNCHKTNHSFVLLEECGHIFCRDCVDKLYEEYALESEYSESPESPLFKCPDCLLKIYNILYK